MSNVLDYIRRWRHTRGYGVHSPLAYTIVKECIRPDKRYGFYCDAYLDFEYHEDRRALRRARMIIRLLHLLRPTHVWMPEADKRIVTAIQMIMPRMRVATHRDCPKDTDFIILLNQKNTEALWHKMDAQNDCCLIAFDTPEEISDGVTLRLVSKTFCIFLRKEGMQPIRYEV